MLYSLPQNEQARNIFGHIPGGGGGGGVIRKKSMRVHKFTTFQSRMITIVSSIRPAITEIMMIHNGMS